MSELPLQLSSLACFVGLQIQLLSSFNSPGFDVTRTTPIPMMMMMMMMVTMTMPMPMPMTMMMMVMMVLLSLELLPHVICILSICIVLCLHVMYLVPQCFSVQIECSTIAFTHMQRNILSPINLFHGILSSIHELRGESQLAMSAEDGEGGDVAVALVGLFLHLRQDVPDDPAVVVLRHVEELRPRQDVVQVVLHLVVLG